MAQLPHPLRFRSGILMSYLEVAQFVGLDPYALLKAVDIDPRLLVDPDAWLPAERVNVLLEESAAISSRDDFGVLLAECQAFSSLGPVALLIEHERTVREIVNVAAEFRPLLTEAITVRLEDGADVSVIAFNIGLSESSPQLTSNIVVFACDVLTAAVEGKWHPSAAHFRHSRPLHIQTYERALRCPIEFHSSYDGLSCDREALDVRSPSAELTLSGYARHLLYLSPEMSAAQTFADRVRNSVYLCLRYGSATLPKVAANIGMSERSVQRKLAEEGQTFEQVVSKTRHIIVTQQLAHSRQSLTEIAQNAGFSSASTLSRWFTKEFGTSPSEWRRHRFRKRGGFLRQH